jgi:hypothetical protein
MHFQAKNTLKNNRYHNLKHTLNHGWALVIEKYIIDVFYLIGHAISNIIIN